MCCTNLDLVVILHALMVFCKRVIVLVSASMKTAAPFWRHHTRGSSP